MRSDARKRAADHTPHPDTELRELIDRERATALLDAADVLAAMGETWGGSAPWLTTGTHVAELAADVIRDLAEDECP